MFVMFIQNIPFVHSVLPIRYLSEVIFKQNYNRQYNVDLKSMRLNDLWVFWFFLI